jgi:outer membrane phospholipase A
MKKCILIFMVGLCGATLAVTNDFQEVSEARQGISFYRPNYAVLGNDPIFEAKLQFSFKFRFVEEGTFDHWWSEPINQLFFSYTQLVLWDLEDNSAPYPNNYLDSYFSPELFWLKRDLASSVWNSQFDLQFGYQHESNGRDEAFGRTWERIYVQPYWTWGKTGDYQFVAMPKFWIPFAEGDYMQNIEEYYGYGELWFKFGKNDGLGLDMMMRKGSKDWNGAVMLDLSYPIRPLNIFVYGQVFYGYGESLRLYDQESTAYRLGIAISR